MKFSTIIPVYNAEKTIEACVESIIHEQDNEIILVNDGSTDRSYEICESLKTKHGKNIVIINQKNKGVSAARNVGMHHATGDYILFVDADDTLQPGFYSVIDKSNYADFVVCRYDEVGGKKLVKHFNRMDGYGNNSEEVGKLIGVSNLAYVWGKFYKRSILSRNNLIFDETLNYGEDNLFVLNYCKFIQSCYVSNDHAYVFTVNQKQSLSKKYVDALEEYYVKFAAVQDKLFDIYPSYKKIFKKWCPNLKLFQTRGKLRNIFCQGTPFQSFQDKHQYITKLYRDPSIKPDHIGFMCHKKVDYISNMLIISRNATVTIVVYSLLYHNGRVQ